METLTVYLLLLNLLFFVFSGLLLIGAKSLLSEAKQHYEEASNLLSRAILLRRKR